MDVSLLTFCGHAEVGQRFEVPYLAVPMTMVGFCCEILSEIPRIQKFLEYVPLFSESHFDFQFSCNSEM